MDEFSAWHLKNVESVTPPQSDLSVDSPEIVELRSKWINELMSSGLITSDKDVWSIEKTQLTYHLMGKHLDNPNAMWFVDPESPWVIQNRFHIGKTVYIVHLTDSGVPGLRVVSDFNQEKEVVSKLYDIGGKSFGWKSV